MKGERPATRSSRGRGRAPDDPDEREKQLKAQLRAMSMYASHTSGDGNCLFRALSDQLYGFPSHYAALRHEICDYLEAAPERFAGFVDIEKPFDEYIRTMRQSGTYGGHLELSAFASLKKKEIKIVQPGLVYVVTGDDDSSEAVAERLALEERRRKMQSRIPPGAEGPPPSARDARRRKRLDRRSRSRGAEAVNGTARAGSSRLTADPEGVVEEGDDYEDEDEEDLDPSRPVEAYGPLYIAYHNWEHYSSIRNLTGPHTGLPRIIERNVSLAAQQQQTSGSSSSKNVAREESDVHLNPKPTEHEELILRSVPGHTLSEVRFLLKQHGNLWETVVEVLIAKDAAEAEIGGEARSVASSPPGTTTRSRGFSYSLGYANGSPHGYLKDSQTVSPSSEPHTIGASPSRVTGKQLHNRMSSGRPTSSDASNAHPSRGHWSEVSDRPSTSSGAVGEAQSRSIYSPKIKATQSPNERSALDGPTFLLQSAGNSTAPSSLPSTLTIPAVKKRAASGDVGHLNEKGVDRASPRPRRRSISRQRDEEKAEEMIVDGALAAAEFSGHTNTTADGTCGSAEAEGVGSACPTSLPREGRSVVRSSSPTSTVEIGASSIATSASTLPRRSIPEIVHNTQSSSSSSSRSSLCPTSVSTPLSTTAPPSNTVESSSPLPGGEEEEFNVSSLATAPSRTYTYSLQTSRNRLLSPPVSPRLLAARREEGNLSAKEKREIELKRKRDRQRERRAQAKRGKGAKSSSVSTITGGSYGGEEGGGGGGGEEEDSGSEWEPGMGSIRRSKAKGKSAKGKKRVVRSSGTSGGGGGGSSSRSFGGESRPRKKRGDEDEDGACDVPSSGFVELKI